MEKRKNFYYKTETAPNEAIEIYLGQNSGKQLSEDIFNAKSEVLIISPYIDESKLDELISLKNRNVNVRLAFSSLREDQNKNILRKLIHQHVEVDNFRKEKKEKQQNLYQILSLFSLCIGFVMLLTLILNFKIESKILIYFFISTISFYLYYFFNIKRNKIKKLAIYNYSYSEKINFKYLRTSQFSKMFIHSKIYVIDRKVAYLGSLNFTNNGFSTNFETRIRITQKNKIEELVAFVHSIYDDNYNYKSHEISFLGKKIYIENFY